MSTQVLDRWLGERLDSPLLEGEYKFIAMISSAKEDKDHPRRAVVRALIHRGAHVLATEGANLRVSRNAPERGWQTAIPLEYPEDQED